MLSPLWPQCINSYHECSHYTTALLFVLYCIYAFILHRVLYLCIYNFIVKFILSLLLYSSMCFIFISTGYLSLSVFLDPRSLLISCSPTEPYPSLHHFFGM